MSEISSHLHRLDQLRYLPMEPTDYCERWVTAESGKGYLKVCINVLAEATGLSPGTIKNWGTDFHRRPQYVLRLLRQADLLNQIKALEQAGHLTISEDSLRD
ncbi:hypothetical protein ACQ4M4_12540 [Leptolyngbya sp. AN02str]|uniref:hypothetical protein n=1 Tax=Leptolyngbya sp. AN02str TaxID=3423363 RepID=UPI003D31E8EC